MALQRRQRQQIGQECPVLVGQVGAFQQDLELLQPLTRACRRARNPLLVRAGRRTDTARCPDDRESRNSAVGNSGSSSRRSSSAAVRRDFPRPARRKPAPPGPRRPWRAPSGAAAVRSPHRGRPSAISVEPRSASKRLSMTPRPAPARPVWARCGRRSRSSRIATVEQPADQAPCGRLDRHDTRLRR